MIHLVLAQVSTLNGNIFNSIQHIHSFNSIFNMVANINTGLIFALLPVNVLFLAMGMYNMEHVRDLLF